MKNIVFVVAVAAMVVSWTSPARAYPEPRLFGDPGDWTLDVVFEPAKQIKVTLPGETQPRRYWYLILSITNNSGQTVPFYPKCELVTDTFQIVNAGPEVGTYVFDKIKKIYHGKYPFLQYIDLTDSEILEGPDNAIDVAIIWPDFDFRAKEIRLFIAGLGNETVVVPHPTKTDENGLPIPVYLRKNLELRYSVGGDARLRDEIGLKFENRRWVLR